MPGTARVVVNGVEHEVGSEPDRSLLQVLREELRLTGAKPACGEGVCGACTVLLDGEPVRSCRLWLTEVGARPVTTVEGLAREGRLHPVQQAFMDAGAIQCGYCTAGMITTAVALLMTDPDPDEDRIRESMATNVCRCGTYPRIIRAIRGAAELVRAAGPGGPSAWSRPIEPGLVHDLWRTASRPVRPWEQLRPEARDWFSVLPDGFVVALDPVSRSRSEAGGWGAPPDAWLHVDGGGTVTVFTGKVDIGQDNRTALSQRVAEELRVPLVTVRLVMGDTDLCPFDVGTYGSRSMVDAGEALRSVAAGARDRLLRIAADRWEVPLADLRAADGRVEDPARDRSIAYGELVAGGRRVEVVVADAPVTASPAEGIVGRSTPKVTAAEIVTGTRRYASDLSRPGMLYGRVLRPPALGAELRSLDTSGVEPDVIVVHEGAFVGVAAPDPVAAGRALRAVSATWATPDPGPSEAGLVAHLRANRVEEAGWEGAVHREMGDVDAALGGAPVRLEATYTTAYLAHVALEPAGAMAEWQDGRLTVWTGAQRPFGVREELAQALDLPQDRIRVIVPDTGGGFGGGQAGGVAVEAARLARAAGRPVKVRLNRAEEFATSYFRPAAVIDVRSGAGLDDTIAAWELRNTNSGMFGLSGPYAIADQRLDYQPAAGPLPQGSFRALAATANNFARESHMDELAHRLEVDPLELRLQHLTDERLAAVLRAVAERLGWEHRPKGGATASGSRWAWRRVAASPPVSRSASPPTAGSRSSESCPASSAGRSSTPTTSRTRSRARP
jgi:CO/xanthine dehydrogenase Mo-binding subunit/aerobic-type carbon monoxide dehydrogenase small subunit (CoxS/CutS family)